jgi:hypothetical protein
VSCFTNHEDVGWRRIECEEHRGQFRSNPLPERRFRTSWHLILVTRDGGGLGYTTDEKYRHGGLEHRNIKRNIGSMPPIDLETYFSSSL